MFYFFSMLVNFTNQTVRFLGTHSIFPWAQELTESGRVCAEDPWLVLLWLGSHPQHLMHLTHNQELGSDWVLRVPSLQNHDRPTIYSEVMKNELMNGRVRQ